MFVDTCSKTNDTGLYYELLSLGGGRSVEAVLYTYF